MPQLTDRDMLTIFAIELRKSRMRLWSLVGTAVWLAVLLPAHSRWIQDWPEAALWAFSPLLYVGPLLGAGAADTARLRTENAPWDSVNITRWQYVAAAAAHLGATVAWALLPPLLSMVTVSVVSWTAHGPGVPISGFTIIGLLVVITLVLCGYTVGTLFSSPMLAPALALFVTFALTTNSPTLPASDQPWFQASTPVMFLWAASASVLAVAALLAQSQPRHDTRRRTRVVSRALPASLCLVTLVFVMTPPFLSAQLAIGGSWAGLDHDALSGRSRSTPPTDPACATTAHDTTVCVWPSEADRYLLDFTEWAERFDVLRAAMNSTGAVTIGQPGLVDERDAQSILVETFGDGDGLWLAVGPIASWAQYASEDFAIGRCDYFWSSPEDQDLAWTLHLVSSAYVFGADMPSTVHHPGSSDSAEATVADIRSRPDDEQLAWIVESNDTLLAPCLEELNAEE
ncbi:hypothetical protein [Sanguibacter antarcticus]|nr:hypothetical protein [Sanguibacter antarcticus]